MTDMDINREVERMQSVQANLLRDSSDGIIIIEQNGTILNINPRAMELFGIPDDYRSKTYAECFMKNDKEENDNFHQLVLDAILDVENVHRGQANYTFPDGHTSTFQISSTYTQLDEDNGYLMLHLTDITLIEEARVAAEKALEVKNTFLQNMTHEIRTPLNFINGITQILSAKGMVFSTEEYNEYSTLIRRHTDALTMLVNDILLSCDIDSGTYETKHVPCNLCQVVQHVMEPYVDQKPGVDVTLVPAECDCTLETDPELLSTALGKLVHNAVKFTDSGRVTITCYRDADGTMGFIVEDTGKGIPQEHQERVFARFYKVDPYILGAGLGLSLCRDIMNMLHGTVTIDATYTTGTRVRLTVGR